MPSRKMWYGLLMLTGLMLLAAACGSGGPQERSFSIEIRNGNPVDGASTLRVKQGDTVKLKLKSDADATFHLHGYDIKVEVEPSKEGEMSLEANATGRFAIEIEKTEVEVAYLEVQPR